MKHLLILLLAGTWLVSCGTKQGRVSESPIQQLLMCDIRQAIGQCLLTFADYADTSYVDYRSVMPYIDFINLMTYDMADPPYHHSALYRSEITSKLCSSEAIDRHIDLLYGALRSLSSDLNDYRLELVTCHT